VRTSNDATAHSTEDHLLSVISDNSWTESLLTWNNRPLAAGTALATLTGMTALNTTYQFDAATGPLATRLNTTASLKISGTGGDNVRFHSQNATVASTRPTLTLTFSPTP